MVDVNDDAKGGYRRIEVLTGPGRRRRWSAQEKGQIVAETLERGARVSEVARCWQVCLQELFCWRREVRRDMVTEASKPQASEASDFVPILSEVQPPATLTRKAAAPAPVIEVELAGALVRVYGLGEGAELTAVRRAIRASASDA